MTYQEWVDSIHKRGGWPTRMPNNGPNAGALAAHVPDGNGKYTLELAPVELRLKDQAGQLGDAVAQIEGKVATVADNVVHAVGLDYGAPGLFAKAIGLPAAAGPWIVVGGLAVVGYAMLRNYGVVPPLKKVLK